MKIRNLAIFSFVVLIWEAFLGHTALFGAVDLYVALGALTLFDLRSRNIIWVSALGILVSFISIGIIGLPSLCFGASLFAILVIDRFLEILAEERNYLAVFLFLSLYRVLFVGSNYLLNGHSDFGMLNFFIFLFTHLVLVYMFKYLLKPGREDVSFKV
ncbi:hypothetical protein JW978_02555 [Candidatus Dojkabacteria bacterium]|nr:hypothetical protein [Candidatus Dojkabacteria bacterium]